MKKICRKIKLRKLKSGIQAESWKALEGTDFLVVFSDGTTEHCLNKNELYNCLSKDHIKNIRYIFDMTDRIVLDKTVIIDTDNV